MEKNQVKKLALAGMFCAVAVVGSLFSFPVFGSKCAPIQHMVNILCAVLLGPWYGLGVAFAASLIRNLLGIGTLWLSPAASYAVSSIKRVKIFRLLSWARSAEPLCSAAFAHIP